MQNCYIYRLSIPDNNAIRIQLGAANVLTEFKRIVIELKSKYEPYHKGDISWGNNVDANTQNLILPPWLCQPYIRILPEEHIEKVEKKRKEAEDISKSVC